MNCLSSTLIFFPTYMSVGETKYKDTYNTKHGSAFSEEGLIVAEMAFVWGVASCTSKLMITCQLIQMKQSD